MGMLFDISLNHTTHVKFHQVEIGRSRWLQLQGLVVEDDGKQVMHHLSLVGRDRVLLEHI